MIATRGFTLIELIAVLAVAAILLSIVIPGFNQILLDSRRAAAINSWIAALHYSRTEAISKHMTVTICRSASAATARPLCAGAGGWEAGWLIFADDDQDGVFDDDEALLRVHELLPAGATLRGNAKLATQVTFRSNGMTINNGRLAYCDRRGWTEDARILVVATTGRVRLTTPAGDSNSPLPGCMS
jgi:type IV fimbrial biogenesis protein FimT